MAYLDNLFIRWLAIFLSLTIVECLQKRQADSINNTHFDYVILGGGTAGLVIASRLSEDPSVNVAVIEAGDFQRNNPNVTSSTALGVAKDTQVDWQYASNTGPYAGNRSLIWSAGKGLGGSSLINGKCRALE
jgi:choline dehydrogenase-like flavoprotein